MGVKTVDLVNAFTDLDEALQNLRTAPLDKLQPLELVTLGQFYEWSKRVVDNEDVDMDGNTELPTYLVDAYEEVISWA